MTFRRMLQRLGHYGEHYSASDLSDSLRVLIAAGGAGVLTAFTVVVKYSIIWLKLPLIGETSLFSLNYALSFLLMQSFGFRLATKQPSILALTLLNKRRRRSPRIQIAAILRSQAAATVGNFGFVIAAALIFHFGYLAIMKKPFLSPAASVHSLESLNPFETPTMVFAAFTGVLLWLSSLVAGWTAYAAHRIKRRRLRCFRKHAAGIGFNVSLGIFLGAAPALGHALGITLDARHFTLSSGSAALAVFTLGPSAALKAGALSSLLGIGVIGIMNFAVSGALAFIAALSAHGLSVRRVFTLFCPRPGLEALEG